MPEKLGMSLVLTCYNRQEYVREAILSVFAQDYDGPMQLVIVDDASTDDSLRVIEETVRERGQDWDVEIVSLPENRGVAGATDAGWAKAKYEWILMVDGDDVQLPDRCRIVASSVEKYPEAVQISCALKMIDEQGREFNECSYGNQSMADSEEELFLDAPDKNYENLYGGSGMRIRCVGASFHRKVWDMWGPLCYEETEELRFEQDPTLAFRAALLGAVLGVRKYALCWRMHNTNLSNRRLSPGMRGVMEFERYQEKYQDFHAASVVCMLRDVRRAMQDSSLTNWPADLLQAAERKLEAELAGCQIRSMWWSVSWFERVKRLLLNWKNFRASGTSFARMLPFRLFCWLKYRKQKREWARKKS